MASILSVSITKEQEEFLEQMNMSPSKLLQNAITEEMVRSTSSLVALKDANGKISRLAATVERQRKFIESKKLLDAFLSEDNGTIF